MKASHRKDVIIARLIFAAICLFLIALIATIVITITSKGGKKKEQDKVQQNAVSESETDSAGDSNTEIGAIYLPQQTTEGTEKTYVTTTSSVNMREKPDKNANIVTVIGQNVKLEFVSEDNGWTQVIFQGQTGYVSSDYVKSDMADGTTDSGTSVSSMPMPLSRMQRKIVPFSLFSTCMLMIGVKSFFCNFFSNA